MRKCLLKKIIAVSLIACMLFVLGMSFSAYAESNDVLDFSIDQMVKIKANPDFHFYCEIPQTTGKTVTPGENSPISNDYYISKYLVTNAQYKEFLDATDGKAPSYWQNGAYPNGKADHPVLYVSYINAVDYCEWLSSKHIGWTFRIPTEAEWENACYASALPGHDSYKYPWGNDAGISYSNGKLTMKYDFNCNVNLAADLLDENGNYGSDYRVSYVKDKLQGTSTTLGELLTISEKGSVKTWADHNTGKGIIFTDLFASINAVGGTTFAVDEGYINDYGLYGTVGNAWVWTCSVEIATNGAEAGKSVNVVRGGSWYATTGSCSATARGEGRAPNGYYNTIGFRLAADYSGEPTAPTETTASTVTTAPAETITLSETTAQESVESESTNGETPFDNKERSDVFVRIVSIIIAVIIAAGATVIFVLVKKRTNIKK